MKFKYKIVALFVTAIVFINLGIGIYAVNSVKQKVLGAAQEKLLSDAALGNALLEQEFPGDWTVSEGNLYKGTVKMNNNFGIVDKIGELTGDTVTIFQGNTRVSTNVKDTDGNRAINTQATDIVKKTVLDNGETYIGKANVVGVWNQTVYHPIRNAKGDVIGIWYVGIPNTIYDQLSAEFRNMLILFAVVAGEVRNLSIRTTDAVKQTRSLIEVSGQNVKIGIDVSNRMSEAREAIKASIKAVETRIEAVGSASEQQTQSIHEINSGITIIANVVHTNSATSEETAAASEELFNQAEILKKQTNQFKLE